MKDKVDNYSLEKEKRLIIDTKVNIKEKKQIDVLKYNPIYSKRINNNKNFKREIVDSNNPISMHSSKNLRHFIAMKGITDTKARRNRLSLRDSKEVMNKISSRKLIKKKTNGGKRTRPGTANKTIRRNRNHVGNISATTFTKEETTYNKNNQVEISESSTSIHRSLLFRAQHTQYGNLYNSREFRRK